MTSENLQQLFDVAKTGLPSASPHTRTRVFAELDSRQNNQRLRLWKGLAIFSAFTASALVVFLSIVLTKSEIFQVQSHKPVLVEVNVKQADYTEIARAEIELPEGVTLYSVAYPELNGQRNLTVAWNPQDKNAAFPFVVKSDEKGLKKVKVRFYNKNNELAEEKILTLSFQG